MDPVDKDDCAFCAAQSTTAILHPAALFPHSLPILLRGGPLVLEAHTPHAAAQAIMSLVLDTVGPPPHLVYSRTPSWPCPNDTHQYPASTSSPAPMSPRSLPSYMSHVPESPLPSQEINNLPASSWYSPSVSAPDCHIQSDYAAYGQYMPPHTSSITLSPPTSTYTYLGKPPLSTARIQVSAAAMSPTSAYTRDSVLPDSSRPSEEPQPNPVRGLEQSAAQWRPNSHLMDRPHSSSSSLHSAPLDTSWTMDNPLGIQTGNLHQNHYYSAFHHLTRSPRLSEPLMELPSRHLASPQPRRLYTPIAPQPLEPPRSSRVKRGRDDDEEGCDETKRRKRSDSNTSGSAQFELSDEDKLLLQLKEEESMPWKDIAARFQSDLGKAYQIPALQMRLKRLRERMRVWTETDVRALRMAHEYWAQNKFDIIAQKMLDFGAQEKWIARQCARKWAEIDPAPAPYPHFEQHLQHGLAPYNMSPAEAPHPFMPYMNVQ
ncbi:hypothetical protein BDU57DRAFT_516723 [Ampelomyces quisqualis]|uniref:Myb-like domain-containing protein n=1 Tax=Ampelomyces quisqualis TaxID=50730 RepID=A0A6A5QNU4_AMPQU|nr:hypothetical protein BDU57DRAFT_516723 [Ampelomyces quisqualis]